VATGPDRCRFCDLGHFTPIRIQNAADECENAKLAVALECSPELQGIR
jgi:hypothetical protein